MAAAGGNVDRAVRIALEELGLPCPRGGESAAHAQARRASARSLGQSPWLEGHCVLVFLFPRLEHAWFCSSTPHGRRIPPALFVILGRPRSSARVSNGVPRLIRRGASQVQDAPILSTHCRHRVRSLYLVFNHSLMPMVCNIMSFVFVISYNVAQVRTIIVETHRHNPISLRCATIIDTTGLRGA